MTGRHGCRAEKMAHSLYFSECVKNIFPHLSWHNSCFQKTGKHHSHGVVENCLQRKNAVNKYPTAGKQEEN
jgi:hypothetical protein